MWFWLFWGSFLSNLFLFIYVRWLLEAMSEANDNINDVSEMIKGFTGHISTIHELEMFYGDETLKSLMEHAKELSKNLNEIDLILNEETELAEEEKKED